MRRWFKGRFLRLIRFAGVGKGFPDLNKTFGMQLEAGCVAFEMKIGAFQLTTDSDVGHKSCKSSTICSNSHEFTTVPLFLFLKESTDKTDENHPFV